VPAFPILFILCEVITGAHTVFLSCHDGHILCYRSALFQTRKLCWGKETARWRSCSIWTRKVGPKQPL